MMRILLLMMLLKMAVTKNMYICNNSTAEDQLVNFKLQTKVPIGIFTTSAGAPVDYEDATNSLNRRLIFHENFMDSLIHHLLEREPERFVHAKGAGAFGYFQVTHNITDICKADLFSAVGKKTPVAVRFSTVDGESGSADTTREPRGFAVKHYTKQGNWDLVAFSTPLFSMKDPLLFPSVTRARKRNPETHLPDANMLWDLLILRPENLAMFLITFGDRGIPNGYRYMPGFGIHTFQVENKYGQKHFVRFHLLPVKGLKNLTSAEAIIISGIDPDYAVRDLYNAIAAGNYPSWELSVQVLTHEDVKKAKFDVFDVTRKLSLKKYPLRPIGKMVLKRNPRNFYADVEQMAFCPSNLVPGIHGAPDKIFEARRLAYRVTQNHRLGKNFFKIRVNCPLRAKVLAAYTRDGRAPVKDNYGGIPNYYPNTFNGPVPYKNPNRVELVKVYQEYTNNFEQTREVYLEMKPDERSRAIDNIAMSLGKATPELQRKAVELWTVIHADLGSRIEKKLKDARNNPYPYI